MIFADLFKNFYDAIVDFLKNNLRNFATALRVVLPYLMFFVGQLVMKERERISVGFELFIPIAFAIAIYVFHFIANKINKGISIPVPRERFTEVHDDGEVNVEKERLHELILYVADIEDWLQRRGFL